MSSPRLRAALAAAAVASALLVIPVPSQAAPSTFFVQRSAGAPIVTQAGKPTVKATAAITPRVVSRVTLGVTSSVNVGQQFRLSGKVSPVRAGVVVQRQRLLNGSWQTLGSAKTNKKGVWTMTVTAPNTAQTIVYRVVAPRSKTAVVTSARVTVQVKAASAQPSTSPTPEATPAPTPTPTPTDTATATPTPSPTIDALGLGGRILGTDISRWQHPGGQPIDFVKMYNAGARYVFIKASDGDAIEGNGLGHGNASVWFRVDRDAAQAAGLLTGFYHFAQLPSSNDPAVIIRSARLQADLAIGRLAQAGGYNAKDLPYVFDLEVAPSGVSRASITLFSKTWLDEMERRTGKRPIVYASPSYLEGKVSRSSTDSWWRNSPLWIAHYMSDAEVLSRQPGQKLAGGCWATPWTTTNCQMTWTFWQYTSSGPAQNYGIPSGQSRLDLNLFNGTSEQLMALTTGQWIPAAGDFMPENEPTFIVATTTRVDATTWNVDVSVTRVPNGQPVIAGVVSAALNAAAPLPVQTPDTDVPAAGNVDQSQVTPTPTPTTTPTTAPPTTTPRVVSTTKIADGLWRIVIKDLVDTPADTGLNTVNIRFTDNSRIHTSNATAVTILN